MLAGPGEVKAVVALPAGLALHGLMIIGALHEDTVGKFTLSGAGTEAEWAVLADCYDSAMQAHKAHTEESRPLSRW